MSALLFLINLFMRLADPMVASHGILLKSIIRKLTPGPGIFIIGLNNVIKYLSVLRPCQQLENILDVLSTKILYMQWVDEMIPQN